MRTKLLLFTFVILTFLLSACSNNKNETILYEPYITALDAMMETDKALNHNAEFISIDISHLPNMNEQNINNITSYFEDKYKINTIIASIDDLKEKGMYNSDTLSLDGVLLNIEKVDVLNNKEIWFEGSKFKSGLGAFRCKIIVNLINEQWLVKKLMITGES